MWKYVVGFVSCSLGGIYLMEYDNHRRQRQCMVQFANCTDPIQSITMYDRNYWLFMKNRKELLTMADAAHNPMVVTFLVNNFRGDYNVCTMDQFMSDLRSTQSIEMFYQMNQYAVHSNGVLLSDEQKAAIMNTILQERKTWIVYNSEKRLLMEKYPHLANKIYVASEQSTLTVNIDS